MTIDLDAADDRAPSARRTFLRVVDALVGFALYVVAVLLGLTAGYAVMYGLLADPCPNNASCDQDYVGWGIVVCWGGTILALATSLAMLVRAAATRRWMWYWPVVAIAVIYASSFGGIALAGLLSAR
ncbi:hypothetical protein [Nocardia concava]|uniref:hypothetical protein n=1 Tax=Nocardia concava TaxID=257281 RepID=UPI000594FD38|nr:hypothetical protein [Nocardia concava]